MMRRRFRKLWADSSGMSAVEFALVMPILLTLFLVGYALSDAISCNRKITTTARAVADLTTRYTSVQTSDVTTILNASSQILSPYQVANAGITVSELQVTSATAANVVWSQSKNGTARTVNSTVTIPNGMATVGTYLIYGEVSYTYQPLFSYGVAQSMVLRDSIFMSPRLSDQVPLT